MSHICDKFLSQILWMFFHMFDFVPSGKKCHTTNVTFVRPSFLMHCPNMRAQAIFSKSVIFTLVTLVSHIFQMWPFDMYIQSTSITTSKITKITFKRTTVSMNTYSVGMQLVTSCKYFGAPINIRKKSKIIINRGKFRSGTGWFFYSDIQGVSYG